MMFTRTVLVLSLLASVILVSLMQSFIELTPDTPIKCTIVGNITHYAQYTSTGNLVASFNQQTNAYAGALVTEYGAVNYSPEAAEALFNRFIEYHKTLTSPLGSLLS